MKKMITRRKEAKMFVINQKAKEFWSHEKAAKNKKNNERAAKKLDPMAKPLEPLEDTDSLEVENALNKG